MKPDPISLAAVKTPYGRYWLTSSEPVGKALGHDQLPSCGRIAHLWLQSVRRLRLLYSSKNVQVNGDVWILHPSEEQTARTRPWMVKYGSAGDVSAVQRLVRDGVLVELTFGGHDTGRGAYGHVVYMHVEDGTPVCADAIYFSGEHAWPY
jgi:hypothetical protein